MAILTTEGDFSKRVGDYVLYRLYDKVVVRTLSGFTTEELLNAPHYSKCRDNASEFGRLSAQCKQLRLALQELLPRKNNLAIVNTLTKKMREVMACDTTSGVGQRNLATALTTKSGKQLLQGYAFNPEANLNFLYAITGNSLHLKTTPLKFPQGAQRVGLRTHTLAFDFTMGDYQLQSGTCALYSPKGLKTSLGLPIPTMETSRGVLFTLLEAQFFTYTQGCYLPMQDDRSKGVIIVAVV